MVDRIIWERKRIDHKNNEGSLMFAYPQELMALSKLRKISCHHKMQCWCAGRQLCVSFSNFKVTKRHDKEEKTKSFMVEKYTRDPFARVQITFSSHLSFVSSSPLTNPHNFFFYVGHDFFLLRYQKIEGNPMRWLMGDKNLKK